MSAIHNIIIGLKHKKITSGVILLLFFVVLYMFNIELLNGLFLKNCFKLAVQNDLDHFDVYELTDTDSKNTPYVAQNDETRNVAYDFEYPTDMKNGFLIKEENGKTYMSDMLLNIQDEVSSEAYLKDSNRISKFKNVTDESGNLVIGNENITGTLTDGTLKERDNSPVLVSALSSEHDNIKPLYSKLDGNGIDNLVDKFFKDEVSIDNYDFNIFLCAILIVMVMITFGSNASKNSNVKTVKYLCLLAISIIFISNIISKKKGDKRIIEMEILSVFDYTGMFILLFVGYMIFMFLLKNNFMRNVGEGSLNFFDKQFNLVFYERLYLMIAITIIFLGVCKFMDLKKKFYDYKTKFYYKHNDNITPYRNDDKEVEFNKLFIKPSDDYSYNIKGILNAMIILVLLLVYYYKIKINKKVDLSLNGKSMMYKILKMGSNSYIFILLLLAMAIFGSY